MKPGGIFVDVGRKHRLSVGGCGGNRGEARTSTLLSSLFRQYFQRLERLVELNPEHCITVNSEATGEAAGDCTIYVTRESGQNTMVPAYKSGPEIISTLKVPVVRLDSYLAERKISRFSLLKIDAEGFELPVLKGLQTLSGSIRKQRPGQSSARLRHELTR